MKEKPPILNITLAEADKCRGWESDRKRFIDWKLECQRDNDVAYYEPIIQQIIEEWQDKLVKRDVGWLKQKAIEIRQAKADVAEDIGGLICCLAGNLMLEDKEAGTLLAKQLQPLIDTIKIRYLPHLPRKEMDK